MSVLMIGVSFPENGRMCELYKMSTMWIQETGLFMSTRHRRYTTPLLVTYIS